MAAEWVLIQDTVAPGPYLACGMSPTGDRAASTSPFNNLAVCDPLTGSFVELPGELGAWDEGGPLAGTASYALMGWDDNQWLVGLFVPIPELAEHTLSIATEGEYIADKITDLPDDGLSFSIKCVDQNDIWVAILNGPFLYHVDVATGVVTQGPDLFGAETWCVASDKAVWWCDWNGTIWRDNESNDLILVDGTGVMVPGPNGEVYTNAYGQGRVFYPDGTVDEEWDAPDWWNFDTPMVSSSWDGRFHIMYDPNLEDEVENRVVIFGIVGAPTEIPPLRQRQRDDSFNTPRTIQGPGASPASFQESSRRGGNVYLWTPVAV